VRLRQPEEVRIGYLAMANDMWPIDQLRLRQGQLIRPKLVPRSPSDFA